MDWTIGTANGQWIGTALIGTAWSIGTSQKYALLF